MGRSYLIDHCINYHKRKVDDINFRVSVAENTRGLFGFITGRWDDIPSYAESLLDRGSYEGSEKKEETAQEVIDRVKNKLALAGEKQDG